MSVKENLERELKALAVHNEAVVLHQQAATQCVERIISIENNSALANENSAKDVFNGAYDALIAANKQSNKRDAHIATTLTNLNNLNAENRQFIQKESFLSKQPLHNIAITAYNSSVQCFENLETFKKFNSSK